MTAAMTVATTATAMKGVHKMNDRANFRMFTINEAAEFFGLPKYFVRQLVLTREIPSIKAGKKYLVNENILVSYLQSGAKYGKL
jgi:excisionase family DNA binding protein